jgi:hypothetical protein
MDYKDALSTSKEMCADLEHELKQWKDRCYAHMDKLDILDETREDMIYDILKHVEVMRLERMKNIKLIFMSDLKFKPTLQA